MSWSATVFMHEDVDNPAVFFVHKKATTANFNFLQENLVKRDYRHCDTPCRGCCIILDMFRNH